MGLERMVSKHRESTYRSGRFDRWINTPRAGNATALANRSFLSIDGENV
jgi:hypothetical protein